MRIQSAAVAVLSAILAAGLTGGVPALATIRTPAWVSGALAAQAPAGPLALQAPAARRGEPVRVYPPQAGQPFQDWTFESLGTLGQIPASQRRHLGVTGYDLRRYGADTVGSLQLTPGGQGSGLCLANRAAGAVLAGCGHAVARGPGLLLIGVPTPDQAAPGRWLLSLAQAPAPGHHLALYADAAGNGARFRPRSSTGAEIWAPWRPPGPLLPVVTGVSPDVVNDQAGNSVIITGRNFTGATAVYFRTNTGVKIPVASFVVNSDTQITAYPAAANPPPPAWVPLISDTIVQRGPVAGHRNPSADAFLQEDAQVDEICPSSGPPYLILYTVPDNTGTPTNATLTDLSDNTITPVSTNSPALDGTPGWRESVPPMTELPSTGTQTFQIHDTTFNITWTAQITFGGPTNCGKTVFRG